MAYLTLLGLGPRQDPMIVKLGIFVFNPCVDRYANNRGVRQPIKAKGYLMQSARDGVVCTLGYWCNAYSHPFLHHQKFENISHSALLNVYYNNDCATSLI